MIFSKKATTTSSLLVLCSISATIFIQVVNGVHNEAPVCFNDDEHDCECGLYLAPSHNGDTLSLYNGNNPLDMSQLISIEELILPMIDANKNEYSPWHDYTWTSETFPTIPIEHKYNLDYILSGMSSLITCSDIPNIKFQTDTFRVEEEEEEEVIASSSTIRGLNLIALTDILPGQELSIDCTPDYDIYYENSRKYMRPIHWLKEYGVCVDTLSVKPSTIPNAGRGAFAKQNVNKGNVIITSPVLHIDRSQVEIYKQEYKEQHVIPIAREHNIEYTSTVIGKQILLNYCFGHIDSNVLLLPLSPGVNYITHNEQKPNAIIRWSKNFRADSNNKLREELPVMELFETSATDALLIIEYIALTDIKPGDEIFIDYGTLWSEAWKEHDPALQPFRHEIGIPEDFYPENWMITDYRNIKPDFIGNPLKPGYMAPIRWLDNGLVATPWAFRIGLDTRIRQILLEYCNKMGIIDILRHVTIEGNGLEPGTETHIQLEGDDWFLQRPNSEWRSNLHWLSPGDHPAHEHYLQALSIAGFDDILQSIGEYLGMDGLAVFHVTFIAVSYSTKGFLHHDMTGTGHSVYNVIVPLLLANETNPELDIQDLHPDLSPDEQDFRVGRYKYEYDVAGMMGDGAIHGTSAVDYRRNKEMRLAATVYITDVNKDNVDSISNQYTQAYPPPEDRDLLLSWSGKHWKPNNPLHKLPKPDSDHILIRQTSSSAS